MYKLKNDSEIMKQIYLSCVIIQMICILLAMLVFFSIKSSKNQTRDKQLLTYIIESFVTMTGTDIFNNLALGDIYVLPHYLNLIVNAVCFCAAASGCYYWFLYMDGRTEKSITRKPFVRNMMKVPIITLYVLNGLSIFTNWIFIIEPNGIFSEGPFFFFQELIPLFYLLTAFCHLIVEILSHRAKNRNLEFSLYLIFILFSIGGVYLEDYLPILPVGQLSIIIMIEVMFFTLYQNQERKLSEYRTAIVVSQIKPHFIFNVLTAIQVLCKGKAPEAAKLLEQFSEYLRLNIDALDKTEPIPFEEELQHTQNYLTIEQTRFGERLKVEYDIQTTQFRIPALILQPIVENAVKYGVMKCTTGVTVKIAAKKEGANFVVSVSDNGAGFDPMEEKNDGREHIGLKSSKERLQTMCGGKLMINSKVGEGTTITIVIPEEERI